MKQYVTKSQFADLLGVSVRTIERWTNQGYVRLAGRTFGGHWRFDTEEVQRCVADPWFNKRKRATGAKGGPLPSVRAKQGFAALKALVTRH